MAIDFSCGLYSTLVSGTRSRVERIFFISKSNSGTSNSRICMLSSSPKARPNHTNRTYRYTGRVERLQLRRDLGWAPYLARFSRDVGYHGATPEVFRTSTDWARKTLRTKGTASAVPQWPAVSLPAHTPFKAPEVRSSLMKRRGSKSA